MTDTEKQMLINAGLDVDQTLLRFAANEKIYQKFLKMFLEDKNYDALLKACSEQLDEEMFKAAHTLKGLSANLDMHELHIACSKMVELYRKNDLVASRNMLSEVSKNYLKLQEAIQSYLKEK